MGLFEGIENARASGQFRYIKPGRYWSEILAFKKTESPRDKSQGIALEVKVLSVLEGTEESDEPGAIVSDLYKAAGKGGEFFLSNIKAMVSGILELPEGEITEKLLEQLIEDDAALPSAETAFELTYRTPICERFAIQPGFQYVIDPAGDPDADDAFVAFLRAEITIW